MPVVVMQPGVQSGRAHCGAEVGLSVGPLAQTGLDEALGLTVGSGVKGLVRRCRICSCWQVSRKAREM